MLADFQANHDGAVETQESDATGFGFGTAAQRQARVVALRWNPKVC
jgi:hypothetical protein